VGKAESTGGLAAALMEEVVAGRNIRAQAEAAEEEMEVR